ncbi:MAG: alpha/beta fold hydrolase [Cyanobacteriota bacterium]|nr:alpha/beta fold hydrolase [Cyanobacteriota bacterium]
MSELSFLKPRQTNPHAPLFVYLPGMDSTGKLLHSQIGSLEQSFDVRCAAIPADNFHGWKTLAQQAVNAIKRELHQYPQRSVYLCGESFGGCLAMTVALNWPGLIDKLILSNPASSFKLYSFYHWAIPFTNWVPECWHWGMTRALLPFLIELGRVKPRDRDALLAAMRSVPPKTVGWRLSLLRDFTLDEAKFKDFKKPVLLIAGAADRLLPSVREAEWLARKFPQSQIAILPRSGHACLLEKDIKLYEILKTHRWLEAKTAEVSMFSKWVEPSNDKLSF